MAMVLLNSEQKSKNLTQPFSKYSILILVPSKMDQLGEQLIPLTTIYLDSKECSNYVLEEIYQ